MGNKGSKGSGGPPRSPREANTGAGSDDHVQRTESSDYLDTDVPPDATETEKLSWFTMLRMGYEQVVGAIIRPPRAKYSTKDLGPPQFTFRGRRFERVDFTVMNARMQKLKCSHWMPIAEDRPLAELPCVIYLHGNSSCRIGCLENLEVVLTEGATMLAFDCSGSGLSDGDYVTLGWHEKEDVSTVVNYLRGLGDAGTSSIDAADAARGRGKVSSIALWGRSMGAATALLHAHRDPSIAGMVLDSPFADLRQLAQEIVEIGKAQSGYRVPGFVVGGALRMVRSTVLKRTHMDIFALRPIADVDKSFVPALFVAGQEDAFIAPHHSKQIFEKYAGDKELVIVPGDHNTLRPKYFQDRAAIFLRNVLRIPVDCTLVVPVNGDIRNYTLESAWRAAAGDDSIHATMAAQLAMAAAEEAMIHEAQMASLYAATGGTSAVKRTMSTPNASLHIGPDHSSRSGELLTRTEGTSAELDLVHRHADPASPTPVTTSHAGHELLDDADEVDADLQLALALSLREQEEAIAASNTKNDRRKSEEEEH